MQVSRSASQVSIPRRELEKLSGDDCLGKQLSLGMVSIPRRELEKLSGKMISASSSVSQCFHSPEGIREAVWTSFTCFIRPYILVSIPRRELEKLSGIATGISEMNHIPFPFPGGN